MNIVLLSVTAVSSGVRYSASEMTAKLVLTGNTPVKNLHSFIQVNFHQKQGTYIKFKKPPYGIKLALMNKAIIDVYIYVKLKQND